VKRGGRSEEIRVKRGRRSEEIRVKSEEWKELKSEERKKK
jgi:hypothetical protein